MLERHRRAYPRSRIFAARPSARPPKCSPVYPLADARSKERLLEVYEETRSAQEAVSSASAEQASVVQYLKEQIEARRQQAIELEAKYALFMRTRAEDERELRAELEAARAHAAAQQKAEHAELDAQRAQLSLKAAFERAQAESERMAADLAVTTARLDAARSEVDVLNANMPILAGVARLQRQRDAMRATGSAGARVATTDAARALSLIHI